MPFVTPFLRRITAKQPTLRHTDVRREAAVFIRLDFLSCILTIVSTILVGRRCWEGWILAAVNSIIICLIGFRTAQFGFIPANLFCIGLYVFNVRRWRKSEAG